MMAIAPWLAWLAAMTSLVLLAFRSAEGGTQRSLLAILWAWFTAAAWFQFFGETALAGAAGLGSQTLLAVVLLVWWRLDS
jgi:hypothetical protein